MSSSRPNTSQVVNKFEGEYAQRFATLCAAISALNKPISVSNQDINKLIKAELDWLDRQNQNGLDNVRYRAFVLILRDLLTVGWKVNFSNHGIEIASPPTIRRTGLTQEAQAQIKDSVRSALAIARDEQLTEPSAQRFLRAMEDPGPSHKHHQSIRELLADGPTLAGLLRSIGQLPLAVQLNALRENIRPYLVLVDGEERDTYTGIKFGDIWRYFRYTWSLPNVPAPGRKLYYIVRDAGQPNHPVMAIAALSNSALQVKDRDDFIGWTAESVINKLRRAISASNYAEINHIVGLMEKYVEQGLSDVDAIGLVEPSDIAAPSEVVLRRLQSLSEGFARARQRQLQLDMFNDEAETTVENGTGYLETELVEDEIYEENTPDLETTGSIQAIVSDEILAIDRQAGQRNLEARRQMILKKRSQSLYQLLYARRMLLQLREAQDLVAVIETLLPKEEFRAAITYSLFANKRERVGINMMEITTCGAIPPYNYLLGGKLAALLMLSPQINNDYRRRYGNQPSWITSQVKGQEVIRPCDIVFLSTTSLYSVGSSQYNRLNLPAKVFHPDQPEISFKSRPSLSDIKNGGLRRADGRDWQTSGFGTVHFSADTTDAIEQLAVLESGFREINSIFGEGPSPKLRKMRTGLYSVGLEPDVLMRHNQPRLLYCVELCTGSRRYLNGEAINLPDYITHPENYPNATEQIADFWRDRWLSKRIKLKEVIEQVEKFDRGSFSPYSEQVIQRQEEVPLMSDATIDANSEGSFDNPVSMPEASILNVRFLQLLYLRNRSYADFLKGSAIEAVHIPTSLDDFIIDHVRSGFSVVLTGNAGDGKTHVLKWLKHRLGDVKMVLDASVQDPDKIINEWKQAIDEGKPFCLAANEWPLMELIEKYGDQLPVLKEVRRQLDTSLIYADGAAIVNSSLAQSDVPLEKVLVVNLDLRNPLAEQFVNSVIDHFFHSNIFASCTQCPGIGSCDALRNRALLVERPRVRAALTRLLEKLAIFSRHITVRELLGFLSYAVFGARECNSLAHEHGKNSGWYSEQIFALEAQGTVAKLLREYLDPANISHPRWDMHLSFSGTRNSDWETGAAPLPPALAKNAKDFTFVKRRFFFEHVMGQDVLRMLPDDERKFAELLDTNNHDLDLARDGLVQSINTFFCYPLSTSNQNPNNELIVWSSHSYDERVPRAFTSWFSVDRKYIQLLRPRLTPRLELAFDYLPDHLLLQVAIPGGGRVELVVDFSLYHTLMEVQRGLPTVLVDEGRSVRLHRFMSRLEAARPAEERVSRIRSYTVQGQDILTVEVDISRKKFRMFS